MKGKNPSLGLYVPLNLNDGLTNAKKHRKIPSNFNVTSSPILRGTFPVNPYTTTVPQREHFLHIKLSSAEKLAVE